MLCFLEDITKWIDEGSPVDIMFNFGKCKCLHAGHGNLDVNYKMGAASKGNQILGLIRRNIAYKVKKLIIPLYKTIVRPHLEYCTQAWRYRYA